MTAIAERYARVAGRLDERARRAVAASEALSVGHGGFSQVARAAGLSRKAISHGIRELRREVPAARAERVRRPGGDRKALVTQDLTLRAELEALIEPTTRGHSEAAVRWTSKSLRTLAAALQQSGHQISYQTVEELLHEMKYSLQGTRTTREGAQHPERDAQFAYINSQAQEALAAGDPVLSVDTKKEEGTGRGLQERRTGVAAPRAARGGAGA